MADQHLPDGAHQAGGGVSGRVQQVRVLSPHVLAHLQRIYAAHGGKSWSPVQTAAFLRTVQQDSPSELALELVDDKDWDLGTYLKYMTSSVTSVVAPPQEQDLAWPLSAYFISSSHNTYLTGNQLSSDSSADAYKNVLLRGCRCIEVDVWDGDEPDSASDTSISSSDEDEVQVAKKAKRLSQVKDKLPRSLTSRLEKTSLGTTEIPTAGDNMPLEKTDSAASQPASLKQTLSIKEPRVYHGYTLTKEISFREVCRAVRDYGFVVTDTPLVVSLEVHCSAEQQSTMVAIMQETWGDLLLPEPKEDAQSLPPPGELRGKILVKVKYAPPEGSSGGGTPSPPPGEVDSSVSASAAAAAKKEKKPSKIIQALSKLGIYTKGVSFKSLRQSEASMPTHIFSLSESGVVEVHQKSARELFEHNRHFLMRAYPSGLRIRSSNLDPAPFWRKGIQVVALNWQNWDEGMMLNEGMFAGTGGYVLKPEGYRPHKSLSAAAGITGTTATTPETAASAGTSAPPTTATGPTPQALAVRHYTLDLTITVLAAQSLPLPLGDTKPSSFRPYLKVEIHVEEPGERHGTADPLPDDGKEKEGEYKAKTKSLKGIDPDWKGYPPLQFEGIPGVVPELSFVRFLVRDDEIGKDSLAAWACVRLDRLREGYRFVHLLDARGVETEGVVLVRVEKRLY